MKYIYFVHRDRIKKDRRESITLYFSPVVQECLTYAKHASNRYKKCYSVSRREYNAFGENVALRFIAEYVDGYRILEDEQYQFGEPESAPVA